MNFYENYVAMCNRIGKTPSAAAVEIGLSKPAVNRWKNGGCPTDATARKVAKYFGVPVEQLYSGSEYDLQLFSDNTKKPTDQVADGLEKTGYELLTPENRKMIDSLIDSLLKSQSGE